MTTEEELKTRAQAESQALAQLMQLAINQYVTLAGENSVLKAKLAASIAPESPNVTVSKE